ncbi:hypothetical protein RTBOTA2_002996 [Rhodotorula toruloides]|nr:hypothetical protein RTBOTA2_002996 [Rhodotorula toruloides]
MPDSIHPPAPANSARFFILPLQTTPPASFSWGTPHGMERGRPSHSLRTRSERRTSSGSTPLGTFDGQKRARKRRRGVFC